MGRRCGRGLGLAVCLSLGSAAALLAAEQPCTRVDAVRGGQYMTYERHAVGTTEYLGESAERIWFRLQNNTTCPIVVFGSAPVEVRVTDGKPVLYRPYGARAFMDLEITDPESHQLFFAHSGCIRHHFTLQARESITLDVPANYLKAGRIGVRFDYPWDGGTDAHEHRALFDPSDLPAEVREWLASLEQESREP
jgi:hypothetical protein